MFERLHLFRQQAESEEHDFAWQKHSYLRMAGNLPKGPATFAWSERQLQDLEVLWSGGDVEGARDRLARDLGTFAERLSWLLDTDAIEAAESHGEEILYTVVSAAPELYVLPWEVMQTARGGTYLADFASVLVRYAGPEIGPRAPLPAPPKPGVLFAWSEAGGAVPHGEQGRVIGSAASAGGVCFHELAEVTEASLQAVLEQGPPSVLHLLCHGVPGPAGEPPRLSWGPSDDPTEMTAVRLARMLRPYEDVIRLVVLCACGSGDGHTDALFLSSMAQAVHTQGIANVVASRYPLSVPGSKVLVTALYDQMLRQAWSLERALRHTRAVLFRPDSGGHSHPGDAYGLQLYTHDTERFVSANGVEAERPVLASYPFGTADEPVPANPPPRRISRIRLADTLAQVSRVLPAITESLREHAEDRTLAVATEEGDEGTQLAVDTTVDGAQRLISAWRSDALAAGLGFSVLAVSAASKPAGPEPAGLESAGAESAKPEPAGLESAGSGSALPADRDHDLPVYEGQGSDITPPRSPIAKVAGGILLGAAIVLLIMLGRGGGREDGRTVSEVARSPAADPQRATTVGPQDERTEPIAMAPAGSNPPAMAPAGTDSSNNPASVNRSDLAPNSAVEGPSGLASAGTGSPVDSSASNGAPAGSASDSGSPAGTAASNGSTVARTMGSNQLAKPTAVTTRDSHSLPVEGAAPEAGGRQRGRQSAPPPETGSTAIAAPATGAGGDNTAAAAAPTAGTGTRNPGARGRPDSATGPRGFSKPVPGTAPDTARRNAPAGNRGADQQVRATHQRSQRPAGATSTGTARAPLSSMSREQQILVPNVSAVKPTYDEQSQQMVAQWKLPAGVVGVLVVTSSTGRIRGFPKPGTAYADKQRWPHGGDVRVRVFGPGHKEARWPLQQEQTLWVAMWAFDAKHRYSRGRFFEWSRKSN